MSSLLQSATGKLGASSRSQDEDSLVLEQETLKRDFNWLLETEFEYTLQIIDKCLSECAKKFSLVIEPSTSNDSYKILLRHPQQSEPSICVASVDGDRISKADITLRLPGRLGSSKPLRTSIKEHSAWRLRQIQDSANLFLSAQQQLAAIIQSKENLSSPPALCQALLELSTSLQMAEQVLVVPQLPSVAEIYSAESRSRFKPELPEDVVVHFHINSHNLVLTIFNVSPVNKTSAVSPSTSDHSFRVGSTFEHGASNYEVSSKIQVQSVVPWLSSVLHWLQEAQEITQDFIDKVEIFKSIHY